jgi:hypothetical protein
VLLTDGMAAAIAAIAITGHKNAELFEFISFKTS